MYKNYQNSDPFTALDANSVMRQGIVPVASLSARNQLVAHKGMTIYRTDLNREERFDGSNWLGNEPGGYVVYPTSVVGGVVDNSGYIIPNADSAKVISVNGVFSARFRRYRIDYHYYTGDENGNWIRLRAAGTDYAVNGYNSQTVYAQGSGTPSATQNANINIMPVAAQASTQHSGFIEVTNAMQTTGFAQKAFSGQEGSGFSIVNFSGLLGGQDATAYDGFTFALSSTDRNAFKAGAWFKVTAIA